MKKFLSVLIVVALLMSMMTMTISAKSHHSKKPSVTFIPGPITFIVLDTIDVIATLLEECVEDLIDCYKVDKKGRPVSNSIYYDYFIKYPRIIGGRIEGYCVLFDSNGGTEIDPHYYSHGTRSVEPEEPTRDGYKFGGWFVDENCKIKQYEFDSRITYSFTLYAKWIPA
jgi:Listeria/Bacterioides repeat